MTQEHPFLDSSFAIKWSALRADHVVPDMEHAIRLGAAALEAIRSLPDGSETFENTFLALECAQETVGLPWGKVDHLTSVCDHPELRQAHRKILPKVTDFFAEIPLNQALYKKLRQYADSEACASLDAVQSRFVKETLQDFEDAGANLADDVRARLMEIESILADKTKSYADNTLDSLNAWQRIVDSVEELSGLPESMVEGARLDALAKGHGTEDQPKYRFTLHAPSMVPVMRFADSAALRKEMYEAFKKIGHQENFENEGLIREILALRLEKASLLGRKAFPDWVLSRRMAQSGERAMAFIEDLHAKTKSAFDRECRELMQFKSAKTGGPEGPLDPWEISYWTEKLQKETFEFDEEVLRPYFPMASVMAGLFKLCESIFGIRVKETTDPKLETWHPEVKMYAVHDVASGRHIGSFYTDWFPRESKRSGAWMNSFITGSLQPDGTLSPHLGLITGNLTPPVGNRPALLNHRDVETVFHEFGHLLHHLLSEVKIRSLCGTNVPWDFVELPSQIMENWCWERASLDLFARHYETGECIPEDLFQKLVKTRTFGAARMQMLQLYLGRMDMALHLHFDPSAQNDLDAFIRKALEGYLEPVSIEYPSIVRNFSHLFSSGTGYAAGYYSYKWAEVLDADAFTRFAREGIMNPATGRAFRQSVLAKGNSDEPGKLFRDFMGRDPDPVALLVRLGLVAKAS
ncbi:MAG TPA: M3 family metallopeptidase [Oceanipulchritudo sp.]|nr:M3 family metallopeptidase [Oceanipulchritudo sp.]